jgi:hypothetical protein
LIDGQSTTAPCQCHACLLSRLQGIASVLGRGRTGMAASALYTVLRELHAFVEAPSRPMPLRVRKGDPASRVARPKLTDGACLSPRAARLAGLLAADPALREIAAAVLKVRPHDVDAIASGRVLLSATSWKRLFAALEGR